MKKFILKNNKKYHALFVKGKWTLDKAATFTLSERSHCRRRAVITSTPSPKEQLL